MIETKTPVKLTADEDYRVTILGLHGGIVTRDDIEVEFFYDRKDAGAWLQHVYGLSYWDAKNKGIVVKSFHGRGPKAGDAITYRGGGKWDYLLKGDNYNPDKTECHGILDHSYGQHNFGICFGASPNREGASVSCSGGPIPCVEAGSLTLVGLKETTFWRWSKGFAGGNQGGNYRLNVPHWVWNGE